MTVVVLLRPTIDLRGPLLADGRRVAVEEVDSCADAVRVVAQAPADVGAIVVGSALPDPVTVAQRLAAVDRRIPIVLLSDQAGLDDLLAAVQIAPLLGEDVRCRGVEAGVEQLATDVLGAVADAERRRAHEATLEAVRAVPLTPAIVAKPPAAVYLGRLLEQAPIGIVTTDGGGRVSGWNQAATTIFDLRERAALGRALADLFPPSSREQLLSLLENLPAGYEPSGRAVLARAGPADGEQFLEVTVAPLADDGPEAGRLVLFDDKTAEVVARRNQAFLLQAGAILAETLSYTDALERLAGIAVPILGDLCLIDVADEDGQLRRVATVHADPRRQSLAEELRAFPPDPAGSHPTAHVLRTGRSLSSPEMSEEFLRATTRNSDHFRVVMALEFRSYICVPLPARGNVLGVLTLVSAGSGRRFGAEDLALAEDLAGRAGLVIDNARLYQHEHRVAHTLQRSLLPDRLPVVPSVALASRYLPAGGDVEVGGDFYDVLTPTEGALGLVVGDVAGHNIAAASVMGQLRSALRAFAYEDPEPATVVHRLREFWDRSGIDHLATLLYGQLDVATRRLMIVSVGHPPPLLISADDGVRYLPLQPSPPLSLPPDHASAVYTVTLAPGSTLLLYTDGLVETRRDSLDVGLERLRTAVAKGHPRTLESLCEVALAVADRGSVGDDIALLAVQLDR